MTVKGRRSKRSSGGVMGTIEKLHAHLFAIDQRWLDHAKFASTYLLVGDRVALFDTGPTTVIEHVLDAVREIGYEPEEIDCLVFSHIHVDHAGAAGSLCRRYPRLRALAHERGVPHLANPSKLVESMRRVFGENAERWYGAVEPVPEAQLAPLADGDVIDLGRGVRLRVVHTPGHAVHHLSLFEEKSGALLAGEALGVYFPEAEVHFPSTPPPEFDLVRAVGSIEKLAALNPQQVLYAHFGPVPNAETSLRAAREVLVDWGRIVHHALQGQGDIAHVSEKLSEAALKRIAHLSDRPELYGRYKSLVEYRSRYTCGPGYVRYFKQGGSVL